MIVLRSRLHNCLCSRLNIPSRCFQHWVQSILFWVPVKMQRSPITISLCCLDHSSVDSPALEDLVPNTMLTKLKCLITENIITGVYFQLCPRHSRRVEGKKKTETNKLGSSLSSFHLLSQQQLAGILLTTWGEALVLQRF